MRKGFEPKLVFDKHGEIFAISTGADACSEHEGGSQPLQAALCASSAEYLSPTQLLEKFTETAGVAPASTPTKDQLVSHLISCKTINRSLDRLAFITGSDKSGRVTAVLGYSPYGVNPESRELNFASDQDTLAGAWDSGSFAVKVRDEKLVKKLARFAEKLKAGDGMFAGTFLTEYESTLLSGVTIAVKSGLRPEHRQAIAKAQAERNARLLQAIGRRGPRL